MDNEMSGAAMHELVRVGHQGNYSSWGWLRHSTMIQGIVQYILNSQSC
jgi:hypothetical protein